MNFSRLVRKSFMTPRLARRLTTQPGRVVSIDRRGLIANKGAATQVTRPDETELIKELKRLIGARGPLTTSDWMAQCLGHPIHGYYMRKDVFGREGDFVTSPDVSQLFGELLGVWCAATWAGMGSPKSFRIVELGPGRGGLMSSLLRVTKHWKGFSKALWGVHMVENSPVMRQLQVDKLGVKLAQQKEVEGVKSSAVAQSISDRQMKGTTEDNVNVSWHWSIDDVPNDIPTIYLANEFFDALPAHQFQYTTEKGWCEKMVDVDTDPESPSHFRWVLSPGPTPSSARFLPSELFPQPPSSHPNSLAAEVSPVSIAVMAAITRRIRQQRGALLAIDYGADEMQTDSLQAVHKHQFVDTLSSPGDVDLTCHVDFSALKKEALRINDDEEGKYKVCTYGLVRQRILLRECGLQKRLEDLIGQIPEEDEEQMKTLFDNAVRLVDDKEGGMGVHFKCLSVASEDIPLPLGFYKDE